MDKRRRWRACWVPTNRITLDNIQGATQETEDRFTVDAMAVPAQEKAEDLQASPIAIIAWMGETLGDAGTSTVGDLQNLASSLNLGEAKKVIGQGIYLRGIGSAAGFHDGIEQNVDIEPRSGMQLRHAY